MAWVVRGDREYYYRSRREGGRVVRDYYGSGDEARLAAAVDAERRRLRDRDREAKRVERAARATAEQLLNELAAGSDLLVAAALLAAGYHRHHMGEWRKRRGRRD